MRSLPDIVLTLWGRRRALRVVHDYADLWGRHQDALADLAVFCNASSPIQGATEFDRGVEEGKRRVWLHIARAAGLKPSDFLSLSLGERE